MDTSTCPLTSITNSLPLSFRLEKLSAYKLTTLSIAGPAALPNPNELGNLLKMVGHQLGVLKLDSVLSSKILPDPEVLSPSAPRFSFSSLKTLIVNGRFFEREIVFTSIIKRLWRGKY